MTQRSPDAEYIEAITQDVLRCAVELIHMQTENALGALMIAHIGALLVGNSLPSVASLCADKDMAAKVAAANEAMRKVTLQLLGSSARRADATAEVSQFFSTLADKLAPH